MQTAGVTAGTRVAVLIDRSSDLVASLLAILKVGATFIPIATDNPKGRIATVLREAEPHLIVSQRKWTPSLAGSQATSTLWIDEIDYAPKAPLVPWAFGSAD